MRKKYTAGTLKTNLGRNQKINGLDPKLSRRPVKSQLRFVRSIESTQSTATSFLFCKAA